MKKKEFMVSMVGYVGILFVFFLPYSLNLVKSFFGVPLTIDSMFYVKYDYIRQGIPYYQEFFRLLDEHQLGFSWDSFLGNPFFASKGMFVAGDVFAYLAYLFYRFVVHSVPTVLFIITGVKLLVAGYSMQRLLKRFQSSFYVCFVLSCMYMLSGWVTTFVEQVVFLSFYALLPLFVEGIERVLCEKDYGLLIGMTCILACCDLYLFVSCLLICFVYYVIRYFMLHTFELREFIWDLCCVVIAIVIGLLMACIVVLPNVVTILKAPRMNQSGSLQFVWSLTNVEAIIMNFLIPVVRGESLLYHDTRYCFYQMGIYASAFVLLLVGQVKVLDGKKRYWVRVLFGFLVVLLCSPIFGKLLHKDYSLRFTYSYPLFLLVVCSGVFNYEFDKKRLIETSGLLVLIAMVLGFVIPKESVSILWCQYLETRMLVYVSVFVIVEALLCYVDRKKVALFVALIEVVLLSSIALTTQTNDHHEAEYIYFKDEIDEIVRHIEEVDPSFKRYNLLIGTNTGLSENTNAGLYYGIPSLSGYDSVFAYEQVDYLNSVGMYANTNWDFRLMNENEFQRLNAKYTIVSKKYDSLVSDQAKLLCEFETYNFNVYLNQGEFGLAKSCNHFVEKSKLDTYLLDFDTHAKQIEELYASGTIIADDVVEKFNDRYQGQDVTCYEGLLHDHVMRLKIDTTEMKFIQVSIPCVQDMHVVVNGSDVSWYKVDGGFIGFELEAGHNEITIQYENKMMKYGLLCSMIGSILFVFEEWRRRKNVC